MQWILIFFASLPALNLPLCWLTATLEFGNREWLLKLETKDKRQGQKTKGQREFFIVTSGNFLERDPWILHALKLFSPLLEWGELCGFGSEDSEPACCRQVIWFVFQYKVSKTGSLILWGRVLLAVYSVEGGHKSGLVWHGGNPGLLWGQGGDLSAERTPDVETQSRLDLPTSTTIR